jgi:uncharacterized protein
LVYLHKKTGGDEPLEHVFNLPLTLGVLAILLAQLLKIPVHYMLTKQWDMQMFRTTGSMPSSHSAGVMALASSVGFEAGFQSTTFAVAAMIAGVVMYDAIGIRYHAGQQAIALNRLIQDMNALLKNLKNSNVDSSQQTTKQLKTLLGHKPVEVLAGALLGVIFASIIYFMLGKL